jgi:hypothetical protein
MSAARWVANGLAGGLCLAALVLGALWVADRGRRWEAPRWGAERFVALRPGPEPRTTGRPMWVVVVNPRCARCLVTLRALHARRAQGLAALIVDTPARPDAATLRALPPVPVWWDRDRVWRDRWGHRLYGELIGFDATGRHQRTVSGEDALRGAGLPSRHQPHVPVTHRGGGK